jgi:hypothetical protein
MALFKKSSPMEPACHSPRASIDEASMKELGNVPEADVWKLPWGKLRNIWYYIYIYICIDGTIVIDQFVEI